VRRGSVDRQPLGKQGVEAQLDGGDGRGAQHEQLVSHQWREPHERRQTGPQPCGDDATGGDVEVQRTATYPARRYHVKLHGVLYDGVAGGDLPCRLVEG
jgi:hypothetical protein